MKVLFDVTSLLTRGLTANGLYTKHLFRLLRGIGVDIDAVYKPVSGIKENYIESHIGASAKKLYPFFASKGTILHGPSGDLLSESGKFIKVLSINDMAMYRDGMMLPAHATQLQNHLKQQMQNDIAAIFVPSMEVHNEFLVRFPKVLNKVHVIEPGCDHIMDSSSTHDKRVVESPYFLFVGTIDKRSNLAGVIKAFNGFCAMKAGVQLVVVGDNGYGSEAIHKMIDGSSIRDRISIVGYKSGAQLKKLYADALATVIPSYYEGFSFPLVESMKMGTPVITSALGSMKDIGGEGAHLVNPKDPEQIMAGMERVFSDRIYNEKLVLASHEITQKMSWLETAKAVAKVYSAVAK